jgi:hypothetical protein
MNEHPEMDGLEFVQDADSCTCKIFRKDRSHPIVVTEYLSECKRNAQPWQTHPKRMLRHKAMIQCARLAFGFAGIFDPDEAERIIESDSSSNVLDVQVRQVYSQEDFESKKSAWQAIVVNGKKTPSDLISFIESKGTFFTEEQKESIHSWLIPELSQESLEQAVETQHKQHEAEQALI